MRFIKTLSEYLLPILFFAYVAICFVHEISFIGIGIDSADEGWHLSKFKFPEAVTASVLRDHLYSSILFKWIGYDLKTLRAVNLLFLACSAFIFSRGIYTWCTHNKFNISASPWVSQSILFASIVLWQLPTSFIERVPAYNNWSSFLILSCIGLAMWQTYKENSKSSGWIIIGILSALALLIRPPSGIALHLFLVLFLFLNSPLLNLKSIYPKVLLGISLAFIFHFSFIESVSDFISTSMGGMAFEESLNNKHGAHTLVRYFWELFVSLKFAIGYNKFVILILAGLSFFLPKYFLPLIILGTTATTINFYLLGDLNGASALGMYIWRYYISMASIIFICSFMLCLRNKGQNLSNSLSKRQLSMVSLFLISPILFAAGTHTPITSNMNFYASFFWVGMLLFLIAAFKDYLLNRTKTLTTLLFCLTLASSHSLIHGRKNEPFTSISILSSLPAKENSVLSDIGNSKLLIGPENDRILRGLAEIFDKETVSRLPYCINFSAPLYNYHIGLPHPVQPWTAFSKTNFTLQNIDQKSFNRSAIIWDSPNSLLLEQLDAYFPDWKTTHKLAGKIEWFYHEDKISLLVYLPNHTNE